MAKLVIRHDLHTLSEAEAKQYLRDVSEFLNVDPDLNAFDMIWMPNPNGEGKTLCVYARRGTCELLRDKHRIVVEEQNEAVVEGSYVVRLKGHIQEWNSVSGWGKGRSEIAIGSRSIEGLKGRDRDDAIMTASTRALQRLTMQFTGLGILSESEVVSLANQTVSAPNPASDAKLAGSPMVIPPMPSVAVNNAPGKPVETQETIGPSQDPKTQAQVAAVIAIRDADKKPDNPAPAASATPVESTTSEQPETDKKPATKRPRKTKTVALDVEPEVVNNPPKVDNPAPAAEPVTCLDCKLPLSEHLSINSARVCPNDAAKIEKAKNPLSNAPSSVPPSSPSVAPLPPPAPEPQSVQQAPAVPAQPVGDLPNAEQMSNYRTVVATYTKELPPSKDGTYGCTQRMRAFITKWNNGTVPQQMNVKQWDEMIAWFKQFVEKNGMKGLVTYIGDFLGDNK